MKYLNVIICSISILIHIPFSWSGELILQKANGLEYQFFMPTHTTYTVSARSMANLVRFTSGDETIVFYKCSGDVTINNNKKYTIMCPSTGLDWGVTIKDVGTVSFYQGDKAVWNVSASGVIRKNNASDGLRLCVNSFLYARFQSGGIITFTSPTLYMSAAPDSCITLPLNKGQTTMRLTYPSSLTANVDVDGGFSTKLLELSGDDNARINITSSIVSSSSATVSNARILNDNGKECTTMSVGDSCKIYFAPGTVPPGKTLKGIIRLYVTPV